MTFYGEGFERWRFRDVTSSWSLSMITEFCISGNFMFGTNFYGVFYASELLLIGLVFLIAVDVKLNGIELDEGSIKFLFI